MSDLTGHTTKNKSQMGGCYLCYQPGHRKINCPLKPQHSCDEKRKANIIQSGIDKGKLPFLLTIQRGVNEKQSICRPLKSRSHTINFPVLIDKCIMASIHGWLVLLDMFNEECCLWNPYSKTTIELPTLNQSYLYRNCILSKPPTEPHCHILFSSPCEFSSPHFYQQCFCKIGDMEYVQQESKLVTITYFQGKLYGIMNPEYKFVIIEFVEKKMEFKPIWIQREQPWKAPTLNSNWIVWKENILINSLSRNELFLVIKYFTHYNYIVDGSQYRVFRVDINQMECIEVDEIGDQVILIGHYGNGYCCSANSDGVNEFKPNSIYHTIRFGAHIYVYDLNDKSTTSWLPPDIAKIELSHNYWVKQDELSC